MADDKKLSWECLETKHLIRDQWIDLCASVYRLPDGQELAPFYTYHRCDFVVIVALDAEENYILVRQFRQGIQEITTEFPAGGMEEGETPLAAARRELLEETGCVSDRWSKVSSVPSNATVSDNYAHIFLAEQCRKQYEQKLDSSEFVEVTDLSKAELEDCILKDQFKQAVHVMAYYRAREIMENRHGKC